MVDLFEADDLCFFQYFECDVTLFLLVSCKFDASKGALGRGQGE